MFVSRYPLALAAMAGLFKAPRVYARRMLIGGCASGRVFALLAMLMLSLEAVSAASGGSNGTRGTVLAITSCADDGPGTLREALATAPPTVIDVSQLPCSDRTIALTSGEIAFDNDGELTITVEGATTDLAAGDTIVIPAAVERQVHARTAARLIVCGAGDAVAAVPGEEDPRGTPPWIA